MNSANEITGYKVRFTLVVDRPDLRDGSYHPVKAGLRVPLDRTYRSQGAATREAERILAGQEDFSSEYVAQVDVLRLRSTGGSDWVRRTLYRDHRGEAWRRI